MCWQELEIWLPKKTAKSLAENKRARQKSFSSRRVWSRGIRVCRPGKNGLDNRCLTDGSTLL